MRFYMTKYKQATAEVYAIAKHVSGHNKFRNVLIYINCKEEHSTAEITIAFRKRNKAYLIKS